MGTRVRVVGRCEHGLLTHSAVLIVIRCPGLHNTRDLINSKNAIAQRALHTNLTWFLFIFYRTVFSNSIHPYCNDYFQWGYDFFHKRTLGAAQTWGRAFPHMYFVWGTVPWRGQPNDEQRWLQSANCTRLSNSAGAVSSTSSSNGRRSHATRPWTRHQCCDQPIDSTFTDGSIGFANSNNTAQCVAVLEATQCNALYYGDTGPCCR